MGGEKEGFRQCLGLKDGNTPRVCLQGHGIDHDNDFRMEFENPDEPILRIFSCIYKKSLTPYLVRRFILFPFFLKPSNQFRPCPVISPETIPYSQGDHPARIGRLKKGLQRLQVCSRIDLQFSPAREKV